MKHLFLLWLIAPVYFCNAQSDWKAKSDSLALVSRNKADMVLSHFDSINSTKMLYSLSGKNYYVIVKNTDKYKEYYIYTDIYGNVLQFKEIEKLPKKKQTKKKLQRIELDTVSLNKAFDINRNNTDFTTNNQEASDKKYDWSGHSYFVVKDKNGNRYGECCQSAFTKPLWIEKNLHVYLLISILVEIGDASFSVPQHL